MSRSEANSRQRRARRRRILCICALAVMVASLLYIVKYEQTRQRIQRRNERFRALYSVPSLAPTLDPAPASTATPSSAPTEEPTDAPTSTPASTPTPTAKVTATPTPVPSPTPTFAAAVDATRVPLATADANTLVVAMETPPPVQDSFAELLAANPDTIGFLNIDGILSLPVVQRANDNEFYLSHSFDLEESIEGTLFLDGANLLTPEDDCLIVYGHNMRNGTMFRPLIDYEDILFLRKNALVQFDTLYGNRIYAPFAALTVTADSNSARYLNLRQFSLSSSSFDRFIRSLRTLSVWESPLDVAYGDHVLLLVTCEYTHDNGRFVLALRAQRDDESWDQLWSQVQRSQMK